MKAVIVSIHRSKYNEQDVQVFETMKAAHDAMVRTLLGYLNYYNDASDKVWLDEMVYLMSQTREDALRTPVFNKWLERNTEDKIDFLIREVHTV